MNNKYFFIIIEKVILQECRKTVWNFHEDMSPRVSPEGKLVNKTVVDQETTWQ